MHRHRIAGLMAAAACLASLASPGPAAAAPGDDARLRRALTVEGILRHERALARIAERNGDTRASATPGYDASVAYVLGQLRAAGYRATTQRFEFPFYRDLEPPTLARTSPGRETYEGGTDFTTLLYSGSGEVRRGRVVPIDVTIPPTAEPSSTSGCEAEDFAGRPRPGSVALIQRGTCTFEEKAINARNAGYAAVIIFNEGQEGRQELLVGTLTNPQPIPVLGATFELGRELAELARRGEVRVDLTTRTLNETRETVNLLADTAGGDPGRVVLVGGHLDSVPEGPGINDNGSGSSVILETAIQIARLNLRLRNKVRFAFWGAEEEGLFGSAHYVSQLSAAQRRRIELNLNFDMLGSPNFARFVYDGDGSLTPDVPDDAGPAGSDVIEDVFVDYFRSQGLRTEPTAFDGRSDYLAFIEAGIPAGGLFSGAEEIKTPRQVRLYGGRAGVAFDPCYHQACDDIDNLSETALDQLGDGVAHAVVTFADRRQPLGEEAEAKAVAATARRAASFDYRGGHLVR